MRYREVPTFGLSGTYLTYGNHQSISHPADLRETIFNGEMMTADQVRAFAEAWGRHRPSDQIVVGQYGTAHSTAAEQLRGGDLAAMHRDGRRLNPADVYSFLSALDNGRYWMYFDRKTGSWTYLGDTKQLTGNGGG